MRHAATQSPGQAPGSAPSGLGLTGRVALSWTMAGAIAAGGFFFAGLILAGRSAALSVFSVLLLTAIGALLGFLHGSLLAVVGRPTDDSPRETVHHLAAGAIWAIPGFAAAGLIALWIAIAPRVAALPGAGRTIAAVVAALVGSAVCLWAAVEGHRALRNAFSRWPERRFGVPVVLTAFAVLAGVLLAWRPQVWWTELRVTAIGALLLALGITIWIAVPVTWLVLHFLHVRPADSATTAHDGPRREES